MVFNHYARYYNLLYRDKNYAQEADYVHQLLQKHAPGTKTLLEFGCGTGGHACWLAQAGYQIHGIDQSEMMLQQVSQRLSQLSADVQSRITFSQADIRNFQLGQTFDAVISLFHVLSYQVTNQDLQAVFARARDHLAVGGIFLFDCWYGPGVLSDRPTTRVKRLQDEQIAVTRIADPRMSAQDNSVDVHYQVFIRDLVTGAVEEIQECHRMRYLFTPEIAELFAGANMRFLGSYHCQTFYPPDYHSWDAYFVGQRISA